MNDISDFLSDPAASLPGHDARVERMRGYLDDRGLLAKGDPSALSNDVSVLDIAWAFLSSPLMAGLVMFALWAYLVYRVGTGFLWRLLRRRARLGRSTTSDLKIVLDRYTGPITFTERPKRQPRNGTRKPRHPFLLHGDRATLMSMATDNRRPHRPSGFDPHDSRTWQPTPNRRRDDPKYLVSTFVVFLLTTEDPWFLLECIDAGISDAEMLAHATSGPQLDRAGVEVLAALRRPPAPTTQP